MEIKIRQGESLKIIIEDGDNPITGEIYLSFTSSYFEITGQTRGVDYPKSFNSFTKR